MSRRLPRITDRVLLVKYEGGPELNKLLEPGVYGNIIDLDELGVFSTLVLWDNGIEEWHNSDELEYAGGDK